MYRIIRTRTLHALRVDHEALLQYREEAVTAVQDAAAADQAASHTLDSLIQAQGAAERLSKRLAESEAQIEDLRAVVQ
ncbi:hypothetical protein [Streptomyces diastaticus]